MLVAEAAIMQQLLPLFRMVSKVDHTTTTLVAVPELTLLLVPLAKSERISRGMLRGPCRLRRVCFRRVARRLAHSRHRRRRRRTED
jgi:hypothetical protein